MAARCTTAACLGLLKLYGQIPHAIRNAFPNVFGQVACVRRMTGTARPALFRFIDMHEVQIQVAVSKIGQVGRFPRQNHTLGMTAKTQRVVLFAEGCIELRRVFLAQEAEILAAVRDVASAAIVLGDGAMQVFLVFYLVCKRRENLIFAHRHGLVMARHTKACRIILQQELDGRRVWGMTVHTAANIPDDGMLVLGVFGDLLYVFMARVAQEGCEALDQLRITTAVRVMAADTVVLRRLMHELVFL